MQGTERVLQYLARYVYRIAFSNSRLIRIDHGQVTFRYQRCKERRWRTRRGCRPEFIRRFLQHVLPRGTHKVRYYGIWNPSNRQLLRRVQLLTGASQLPAATHDEVTTRRIRQGMDRGETENLSALPSRDLGSPRDHSSTTEASAMIGHPLPPSQLTGFSIVDLGRPPCQCAIAARNDHSARISFVPLPGALPRSAFLR